MGTDEVEYRIGEREVVYSAKKADVMKVAYDDGTEDVFAAPPPPAPAPAEVAQAPAKEPKKSEDGGRDGLGIEARIAYSYFSDTKVTEIGPGFGFLAGGALQIPISKNLVFNPELNFTYRVPVIYLIDGAATAKNSSGDDWDIRYQTFSYGEFVMGIQTLLRGTLTEESKFYFEGGLKLEIPFVAREFRGGYTNINGDNSIAKGDRNFYKVRNPIDVGAVYGFGFNITPKIAFNIRNAVFFNNYTKVVPVNLNQLDISVIVLLNDMRI
jgi:hypothetical protein